jgi:hypothetical protein
MVVVIGKYWVKNFNINIGITPEISDSLPMNIFYRRMKNEEQKNPGSKSV